MATKIRLQRHGKKGNPFFHVVAADSRSPRDGRFIEKLGTYNPTANPAVIDIDFDRVLNWVKKGAEPTDTVRAILSYKGILYKNHLDKGVAKGALTQDQANAKFEKWMKEKEGKIQSKVDRLAKEKADDGKNRAKHEADVNKAKAEKIAAKQVEAPAPVQEEAAPAAEGGETAAE